MKQQKQKPSHCITHGTAKPNGAKKKKTQAKKEEK